MFFFPKYFLESNINKNSKLDQIFNKVRSFPTINLNEIDLAFTNLSMLGKI